MENNLKHIQSNDLNNREARSNKHFAFPGRSAKRCMAIGMFAFMAMGTFTLASGFKSNDATESNKQTYAANSTTVNPSNDKHSSIEKNQAAEIESLRKQVQATSRKFKEYQAQLFRSSHPNDQKKIAELGQLLSEKEKANSQLGNSLKAVEKELAAAHKQISNLEVASEALNSLLNANRIAGEKEIKGLKDEMDHLVTGHSNEKKELVAKLESNEAQHQSLLSKIESFENEKKNLLAKIESNESEKKELASLINALEKEKQQLAVSLELVENDKQNQINKVESAENENKELQERIASLQKEQENSSNEFEQKRAVIDALKNEELFAAQAMIQAHEARILELENTYMHSKNAAEELSSQLAAAHEKHHLTQHELTSALADLENVKSSLQESQTIKDELKALKERHEQQQYAAAADYEETLAIIHGYYQTSLEEVSTELASAHDQFKKEHENCCLLQDKLDQTQVDQSQNEEIKQQQQQHIEALSKDLADTKCKYVFNEQRTLQLKDAVAMAQSQHELEKEKLQEELEKSRSELEDFKQQVEVDKASVELSHVVRETELTAYQLMLLIEIERLNAELAESSIKAD